jgi:hypothetical protein
MPTQEFDLDHIFSYHAPDPEQQKHFQAIREAAKNLAHVIVASTPPSADQTAAIRMLRECVAIANASVALKGRLYKESSIEATNEAPALVWTEGWYLGDGSPCMNGEMKGKPPSPILHRFIHFPDPMYLTGKSEEAFCVACALERFGTAPPKTRLERRPI